MEAFNNVVLSIKDFLWGPIMLCLLIGTHVLLTIRTKGIQRKTFTGVKLSVTPDKEASGDIGGFAALATALAATIGTGNIVGVVPKAMGYFKQMFKKYDKVNGVVKENVGAIRVVKAFVREDYEDKKFSDAAGELFQNSISAERIISFNMPIMQLTVYSCILLISWFGAKMIVNQTGLTTGELTSLLSYVMNILMSLMMLSMVFVMVTQSAAAAQRIEEVLEEQPDITSPENAVKNVRDGSIDFEHVTFAYQQRSGKPVLSDINLHIKSGETIGIMGGTGSSKTSLVSLISRLYDATEGSVRVGGEDVRRYDVESLRDAVSVVLQNNRKPRLPATPMHRPP